MLACETVPFLQVSESIPDRGCMAYRNISGKNCRKDDKGLFHKPEHIGCKYITFIL